MNWIELIQSKNINDRDILLFSTATTGLSDTDLCLAFSYARIGKDGNVKKNTLFHLVSEQDCQRSIEYHKINVDMMLCNGWTTTDFENQINEQLDETVAFSYNPKFQYKALCVMSHVKPHPINDLLQFLKSAESRMAISQEDLVKMLTVEHIQQYLTSVYKKAPSLKAMMAGRDMVSDPVSDLLPLEQNVNVLQRFWDLLGRQEVITY